MSSKQDNGGGLSLATLAIASASSLAAALVVHKFWQAGAFVGAAVTPVIVALVSEGLRKPVDVVKSRTTTVNPPPVAPDPASGRARRDDRFGIWESQRKRKLHVGVAIATGLVAFVIAAFFLTGAELVLGGASGGDKYRVLPGKQRKGDDGKDAAPAQTQPTTPSDDAEPVPEETTPQEVPEETVPAPPTETVPAPPAETVPPPVATTPEEPLP